MKQHRIAVIPYGVGIGDLVNMRPLAEAVKRHVGDTHVYLVAPESLSWLVPDGVRPLFDVPGLRTWARPAPSHPLSKLAARSRVGQLAPLVRVAASGTLASAFEQQLRARGYEVVNLLRGAAQLDLERRWTAGPWNTGGEHVIDLMARYLEDQGIGVPACSRRPQLEIEPTEISPDPVALVVPSAGSTLKELPLAFWIEFVAGLVERGITPAVLSDPHKGTASAIASRVSDATLLTTSRVHQAASWVAGADLVIAPDTGMLHIAAALQRPYVGLFGSTDPSFLGPYQPATGELVAVGAEHGPVCRWCWTAQLFPAARCPLYEPPGCLSSLHSSEALSAVDRVLHAAGLTTP